jgi:hypothetical protein
MLRRHKLAAVALFGIWGLATALFDWVPAALLLFLGFWAVVIQALLGSYHRHRFRTALLLVGMAAAIHFHCLRSPSMREPLKEIRNSTARVSHLFTPSVLLEVYDTPFWSDWNAWWFDGWWLANRIIFIGFTLSALLVAVVGWKFLTGFQLQKPPAANRRAIGILGCAAVLCCFPVIFLPGFTGDGKPFECYLPTALLHALPVLNYHRCPSRIAILIPFLATIWLGLSIRNNWLRTVLGGFVLAGISIEYLPKPLSTIPYEPKQTVWRELAQRPEGRLLNLPVFWRDGTRTVGTYWSAPLLYQPVHQQTLICGYQSRVANATFEAFRQAPVLKHILAHQQHDTSTAYFDTAEQQMFEHWAQPTAVLIDTSLFKERNTRWWLHHWNSTGWIESPVNPPYRLWTKR